jgi:hypothetical protein
MHWDFREGNLPPGVEVVGAPAEFMLQRDGSTALLLPPMSYLKVFFSGMEIDQSHSLDRFRFEINQKSLRLDMAES